MEICIIGSFRAAACRALSSSCGPSVDRSAALVPLRTNRTRQMNEVLNCGTHDDDNDGSLRMN